MPRLLLCGWDAADWHILSPLIDGGELPHLATLIERGAMGDLYQDPPLIPAMCWTTIATGKAPDQHGVLSQREADSLTGGTQPVTRAARRVRALWNILEQAGLRAHVVGWPASHPAEPLRGSATSNFFGRAAQGPNQRWPIPHGSIHPVALEPILSELRVHAGDLTGDDLLWFIPRLSEIDQTADQRPLALAIALAESITNHAVATWLLEHAEWDFLAVHYPLIGDASRAYMRYAPPVLQGVSERDSGWYGGVVAAACRFQDLLLGRLLDLAGPGASVMVLSAHGFLSGRHRPACVPESAMSDYWPRSSGMVCFAGDRVVPDSLLHGARSLDIAPTVLTWCGLPAGLDMPGRVLIEAFGTPSRIPRTETWEAPATDSVNDDPSAGKIIHELEALGYTDPLAAQALRRSDETARERDLNLAWVHLAAGRGEAALELLEPLAGERTALLPYIAYACLMCGRGEDARTALERATQSGAAQSLVGLVRAYMLLLDGRNREAMHQLAEVEKASGVGPFESCLAGDLYRHARRTKDAERCYRAALERDPDCPSAHLGLAQTFLLDSDNQQAAQAALQAIGLKYDLAPAHLTLGVALARLGMEARAEAAFAICLKLEPDNLVAKEWVALLERRRGASK